MNMAKTCDRVLKGKVRQQFSSLPDIFRYKGLFRSQSEKSMKVANLGRASDEIDPGIADLVSIMNKSGVIYTVASCQGHPKKQHPPYVYFSSSPATAARIEEALRTWGRGPDKRLHVRWLLAGQFDEKCQLKFCLHAPEYHERSNSLISAAVQFWLKRNQVQHDLTLLTELMRQTILNDGNNNENEKWC